MCPAHKFYEKPWEERSLVRVDYSKSNENKEQREIQSAYFGQTTLI